MYSFFFFPRGATPAVCAFEQTVGHTGVGWGVSFELADFNFVSGDSPILFLHSPGGSDLSLIAVHEWSG